MNKKISYRMEYLFLKFLKDGVIRTLPRDRVISFGKSFGSFAYKTLKKFRTVSEENLEFVGYDKNLGKYALQSFVVSIFDLLKSVDYDFPFLDSIFTLRDDSTLTIEELKSLNGGILLTAHIGNWELLGAWFSNVSEGRLSVVAKPMKNKKVDNLINSVRESWGTKVIPTGKPLEILKDLKRNRFVAILLDQRPKESEGYLVKFLERDTYVNKGAAFLSLKTGKPVIPAFCYMEKDGSYSFEIHKPIFPESRSEKELTQIYTEWIEKAVRKHPEQWLWSHRRWSNSPEFKKWKEEKVRL